MRMFIPFSDKSQQAFSQMVFVSKIRNLQPFPLQNREPLLDLVHPGAMHRGKVEDKAWMLAQPGLYLLPFVHPHIVEDDMNSGDRWGNLALQMFQKDQGFHLAFARCGGGVDRPRARIKTSKEIQGTLAVVFVSNLTGLARWAANG